MATTVLVAATFVAAISGGYECRLRHDPTPLRIVVQQDRDDPSQVLVFGGVVKLGFIRKARTYHPDYEVWTTSVDMSREIELHVSKSQATFTIHINNELFALCAAIPEERKALDTQQTSLPQASLND